MVQKLLHKEFIDFVRLLWKVNAIKFILKIFEILLSATERAGSKAQLISLLSATDSLCVPS